MATPFDPEITNQLLGTSPVPLANPLASFQDSMRTATVPWMKPTTLVAPAPVANPVGTPDPDAIAGPSAVINQIGDNYPVQNTPMDLANQIGNDKETTVTRKTQDKAEKKAEAALSKSFDDQKSNELEKTDLSVQKANALDAQAQKELELSQELDRKRAEREAYANRKLQEADAYLAAKRKDYEENGTIRDMYGGDVGKRVNAAILSGIGAFAAARGSGMPNIAGEKINAALNDWHNQEMERIKKSKELLGMAREDREHALATADLELKNREVSMLDIAAKQRAKVLSSFGAPEAAIAGDRAIIDIEQKKQQKLQEIHEGLRTTITSKETNQTAQEAKKAAVAGAIKKGELGKPEQGTLEKVGELNNYLSTMDKTLQLAKERPDILAHVLKGRQAWQKIEKSGDFLSIKGIGLGGFARGLGQAVGTVPLTEEQAMEGANFSGAAYGMPSKLSPEDAKTARELYRGIKNIEVGKGMTFGGVLRDSDVGLAQEIASTIHGTPEEQIKAIEKFRNDISQRRDLLTKNKDINMPTDAPASSNAGKTTMEEYNRGVQMLEQMERQGKRGSSEWNRLVRALQAASKELRENG